MVVLLRPDGGAPNAPPQIARQHQAGDLREGMDRSATVGWRSSLQAEIQVSGNPQTGQHGCWKYQEARLAVLPAEGGALPHGKVPALGQESTRPPMLVVPVPLADKGAPLQGVSEVEGGAEDPLGGSEEGDRAVEEPVKDPGGLRR